MAGRTFFTVKERIVFGKPVICSHSMKLRLIFALILHLVVVIGYAQADKKNVVHTLFLVGDGGEPYVRDNPIANVLATRISSAPEKSTVLFLGDNIYPAGLPSKDSRR